MALKNILKKQINENLADYVDKAGSIKLYHYSSINVDSFIANPSMFGQNSFTLGDAKHSTMPRVFFYVNKAQKERFFNASFLYTAIVPVSEIYHLIDDIAGFKTKIREENNGALNFDELFKRVKGAGYKGVYYVPNGIEMINWFYPIKVTRESE